MPDQLPIFVTDQYFSLVNAYISFYVYVKKKQKKTLNTLEDHCACKHEVFGFYCVGTVFIPISLWMTEEEPIHEKDLKCA